MSRLADASGIGVVLQENAILATAGAALAETASALALDPLDLALYGGEDYALVMTFDAGAVPPAFAEIGRCVEGRRLFLESADGAVRPIEPRGFDHFQKSTSM